MWKKVKTAMHFLHWPMIAGMMCAAVVASAGAAAAATPAFQAAVAGGEALKISIPNIVASLPDAGWTMIEGLGSLPEVFEGVANAAEAGELWDYDYQWGITDHGAGVHEVASHGGDHASNVVEHAVASAEGHAVEHVGHCTMDTHGAVFDRWSEENHGGFLSAVFGSAPSPSEQWSQFSEVLCPK